MEGVVRELYLKSFGSSETDKKRDLDEIDGCVSVAAPGRVNLIGEHTDYNHGFVMPLALEKRTVAIGNLNEDSVCRIVSTNDEREEIVEFTLDETSDSLKPGADKGWAKYVKGVIKQYFEELMQARPLETKAGERKCLGFNAAFSSDVPLGGGLSSSASLEVCTATLLEELYEITSVSKRDRALRCVEAEHTFANVPCGIMDQFISSCAVEGCALLLDCRSMHTTNVDLDDPKIRILVTNSNKKHELSGSEYPDRVKQCKEAVEIISKMKNDPNITHLRDVTLEMLDEAREAKVMEKEVVYKRALHSVSEDIRTTEAATAAEAKDYDLLGRLMIESHKSLRDNYEVSTPEIDFLVEIANKQEGVYGSRITGGGFGGCTVTLVKTSHVDQVISALTTQYKEKFGIECTCFSTKLRKGATTLWNHANKPNKKAKH